MMTHATVLTGTALLTLPAVFPRRTQLLTEGSRVSRAAHTLSGDVVARGVVLAQALLLTAVSVAGALAEVLAAPATVSGRTEAGSGDGVTQRPVLTLTAAAAVRTPVIPVTGTGAVGPSPARLTLTGAGGHTAAVHTLLSAVGNTSVSALVESRAALRLAAVHGLFSSAVGRSVADPVLSAFEPVENVCAAGVVNLIERMSKRLLHRHRITLPVTADIRVVQVE